MCNQAAGKSEKGKGKTNYSIKINVCFQHRESIEWPTFPAHSSCKKLWLREHVYAEVAWQLNAAYQQLKRSKTEMNIHRDQTKKTLELGHKKKGKDVTNLIIQLKDCTMSDSKEWFNYLPNSIVEFVYA